MLASEEQMEINHGEEINLYSLFLRGVNVMIKKWLKKNLFLIIFCIVVLVLIITGVDSYVSDRNHNRTIKASNKAIVELKQDRKASEKRANVADKKAIKAEEEARVAEDQARYEREEKEKHKAKIVEIENEKKELRDKIAALDPPQIVVQTIEILRVSSEEITLQREPNGVLFTLLAARENLNFLSEFTLVKRQYGELQISLAKSEASEAGLMKAGAKKDIALANKDITIKEKDSQLGSWVLAEIEWDKKYTASENRGKKARAKGRKEGTVIGAVITTVFYFLLKR